MTFSGSRRGGPGVVPGWSRGGPEVVPRSSATLTGQFLFVRNLRAIAILNIIKRAGASPQQHSELENEQEQHHSNVTNHKTSRSFTTATLRMAKRAGASPQQCCKAQNEQELHHSNIASFKQIKHRKCICHIHNCAIGCFRVANVWFGHIHNLSRMEYEQEPHHSNVANYKTRRACTPAT